MQYYSAGHLRRFPLWLMVFALGGLITASAGSPFRLTVRPHGTNQLEFTVSPTRLDVVYAILIRSNTPGAHWMRFTALIGGSNESTTAIYDISEVQQSSAFKGFGVSSLSRWNLVAGVGEDSDGDGLPDVFEDLVTRTDPYNGDTGNTGSEDGYKDADGDNWVDLQELTNLSDPLVWNQPPAPANVNCNYYTNGTTLLRWGHYGSALPECFIVERAVQSLRAPEPFGPAQARSREPMYQTTPFVAAARVLTKPGLTEYRYIETNLPTISLDQPIFRVQAKYRPLPHLFLESPDEKAIRHAMPSLTAHHSPSGYELKVERFISHVRHLLLCRPVGDEQWLAAGYFVTGTNSSPVLLHTDLRGLLPGVRQRPLALPEVQFLPHRANLEFAAGSGEDGDGDGLPDIYEVLVTRTDPAQCDTGKIGVLDGYKDPDNDGWCNLEEFRRRSNPLFYDRPPDPVELKRPLLAEVRKALTLPVDLLYQPVVAIRMPGQANYGPSQLPLLTYYQMMEPAERSKARPDFDLRIIWQIPDAPGPRYQSGP